MLKTVATISYTPGGAGSAYTDAARCQAALVKRFTGFRFAISRYDNDVRPSEYQVTVDVSELSPCTDMVFFAEGYMASMAPWGR